MFPPKVRAVAFALAAAALAATAAPPSFGQAPDPVKEVLKKTRGGIALLTGYSNGQSVSGTGFLINDRVLITNEHVVRGLKTLAARFDGTRDIDCQLIDDDPRTDLAAVFLKTPWPGHALRLPDNPNEEVEQATQVVLIGHPLGLTWTFGDGRVGALRTVPELILALDKNADRLPGFPEFRDLADLRAIQHAIGSAPGMSGAPLVDLDGRVVGVHKEGYGQGVTNFNFTIPQRYIRGLKFGKAPHDFSPGGGPALQSDFKIVGLGNQADVRMNLDPTGPVPGPGPGPAPDGINVNCRHWGFVPNDPQFVFDNYVGDKGRFARMMTFDRTKEILDKRRVVHVLNPVLRFSMLVPENYSLRQEVRQDLIFPTYLATLTNDDPAVRSPINRLSISAWRLPPDDDGRPGRRTPQPRRLARQGLARRGVVVGGKFDEFALPRAGIPGRPEPGAERRVQGRRPVGPGRDGHARTGRGSRVRRLPHRPPVQPVVLRPVRDVRRPLRRHQLRIRNQRIRPDEAGAVLHRGLQRTALPGRDPVVLLKWILTAAGRACGGGAAPPPARLTHDSPSAPRTSGRRPSPTAVRVTDSPEAWDSTSVRRSSHGFTGSPSAATTRAAASKGSARRRSYGPTLSRGPRAGALRRAAPGQSDDEQAVSGGEVAPSVFSCLSSTTGVRASLTARRGRTILRSAERP